MTKEKGKRSFKKIAVIVTAVAVFATLFVIPFRVEKFEDEDIYPVRLPWPSVHSSTVSAYSPLVPWYKIREDHYFPNKPENQPYIGEWGQPLMYIQRRLVVFGIPLWYKTYQNDHDGNITSVS